MFSGGGDVELQTGTVGSLISSTSSEISLFKSKATDLESTDVGSKIVKKDSIKNILQNELD